MIREKERKKTLMIWWYISGINPVVQGEDDGVSFKNEKEQVTM